MHFSKFYISNLNRRLVTAVAKSKISLLISDICNLKTVFASLNLMKCLGNLVLLTMFISKQSLDYRHLINL